MNYEEPPSELKTCRIFPTIVCLGHSIIFFLFFFGVHAKGTENNKADTYFAVICVHTASHLLSRAEFQREGVREFICRTSSADPLTLKQSLFVGAAHLHSCSALFSFGKCGLEGIVYCDPRICDLIPKSYMSLFPWLRYGAANRP